MRQFTLIYKAFFAEIETNIKNVNETIKIVYHLRPSWLELIGFIAVNN